MGRASVGFTNASNDGWDAVVEDQSDHNAKSSVQYDCVLCGKHIKSNFSHLHISKKQAHPGKSYQQ